MYARPIHSSLETEPNESASMCMGSKIDTRNKTQTKLIREIQHTAIGNNVAVRDESFLSLISSLSV